MSAFAPLPSLRHLPSNSSSSAEYQQRVLDSLRLRLQDLVAFLHPDGSFGDHKSHGSHRYGLGLTALSLASIRMRATLTTMRMLVTRRSTVTILELLTEAQAYFSVDAELVAAAKRWVQSRQAEDGSFAPPLTDLRDGAEDAAVVGPPRKPSSSSRADGRNATADAALEQRIETTAETLVTLLEVGVENEVRMRV